MNASTSDAEELLGKWGEWSNHYFLSGFASENSITKINLGRSPLGSRDAEISMPEDVEHCEAILCFISQHYGKKYVKALKCRYIWKSLITDKDRAKRCGCGRTEYLRRLGFATAVVAGSLIKLTG